MSVTITEKPVSNCDLQSIHTIEPFSDSGLLDVIVPFSRRWHCGENSTPRLLSVVSRPVK